MNQPNVAPSPAVEMKLSPLIPQGKPACPIILAIGARADAGPTGAGKTLAGAVINLFGKPRELKDSHHRYNNQGASYLPNLLGHRGIIAILIGLRNEQPRTLSGNRFTSMTFP